jgi:hypothetical protein
MKFWAAMNQKFIALRARHPGLSFDDETRIRDAIDLKIPRARTAGPRGHASRRPAVPGPIDAKARQRGAVARLDAALAYQGGGQVDRRPPGRQPLPEPPPIGALPAGARAKLRVDPGGNERLSAIGADLSPLAPAPRPPLAQPTGAGAKGAITKGHRLAAARTNNLARLPRHATPAALRLADKGENAYRASATLAKETRRGEFRLLRL